ncbi:MAG: hypothetical protein VX756_06560, partial [Bacteroidota bacterium]|nr:hypothetical protein [Bacteroidota bacterium]
MNRIAFFVFVSAIMLCIDAYFWQAFRVNITNRSKSYFLIPVLYWGVSLVSIIVIFYGFKNFQQPSNSALFTTIRGIVFALIFCKFIG